MAGNGPRGLPADDRQTLEAADEIRRAERRRGACRELEARQTSEHLLDHHPELERGEIRAQAEVCADPERDVLVRRPPHVEAERILEHRRVAIRQIAEISGLSRARGT